MRILLLLLALTASGWSEDVTPQQAGEIKTKLKIGMTRAEVEKVFSPDGGLAIPFKMERYILQSSLRQPKVAKVKLQFRPAGVSQQLYQSGKWSVPQHRQQPGDVLMDVSKPFLEPMTLD
ncbi:MAG: hypothetical protein U0931_33345 [Vulcanimicrobiota bacterium]